MSYSAREGAELLDCSYHVELRDAAATRVSWEIPGLCENTGIRPGGRIWDLCIRRPLRGRKRPWRAVSLTFHLESAINGTFSKNTD